MKRIKVSFDTWIHLLGMTGVLGGLAFVGLEIQQTQRIAIAGQVQARAEMQVNRLLTGLEGNLDANRLFSIRNFDYELLSDEEKFIARELHQWRRTMLENNFFQYQSGLFAEDYWQQTQLRIQGWWDNCVLRPAGGGRGGPGVTGFSGYLNSLPDNCAE
jgi:hypothetical protein|tara:strand:+ start:171 stop:647 length:477 start_codon:yes stop_codon:yes gene_type:complete